MSTDLVELLKENVSPIVLENETEQLFEKNQILNDFYPILLTTLKAKPELFDLLSQQLNPKLTDLFQGSHQVKQQFLAEYSEQLEPNVTEHILERSIIPALHLLQAEAGSPHPSSIAHLIEQNTDEINQHLPAWAIPMLGVLGVPALKKMDVPAKYPELEVSPQVEEIEQEMKRHTWIPFVILALLTLLTLFLYKKCSEDPKQNSVVPTQQIAATEAARFELSTGREGGLVQCQIYLNHPSYVEILQKEVKQIFANNMGCAVDPAARYHTSFVDQDTLPSVLKILKGVPNASVRWIGNEVTVSAQNAVDAEQIANKIRALAKNVTVITAQTPMTTAIAQPQNDLIATANHEATNALASIQMDNVRALDVATALNMQIINFETASTNIPLVNQSILDQAAALMQRASHVNLKVIGHTDAQGNADANKALSQQRAQTVVDYLVSKGVDPAQLQAIGMGQEQPRADNATEEGRFKNRRIEFEVQNTDTGTVRSVDESGVQQQ